MMIYNLLINLSSNIYIVKFLNLKALLCFLPSSYLHVSGDTYGRPIHGQKEVSGYSSVHDANLWQAAEGIFIKPTEPNAINSPIHDEF